MGEVNLPFSDKSRYKLALDAIARMSHGKLKPEQIDAMFTMFSELERSVLEERPTKKLEVKREVVRSVREDMNKVYLGERVKPRTAKHGEDEMQTAAAREYFLELLDGKYDALLGEQPKKLPETRFKRLEQAVNAYKDFTKGGFHFIEDEPDNRAREKLREHVKKISVGNSTLAIRMYRWLLGSDLDKLSTYDEYEQKRVRFTPAKGMQAIRPGLTDGEIEHLIHDPKKVHICFETDAKVLRFVHEDMKQEVLAKARELLRGKTGKREKQKTAEEPKPEQRPEPKKPKLSIEHAKAIAEQMNQVYFGHVARLGSADFYVHGDYDPDKTKEASEVVRFKYFLQLVEGKPKTVKSKAKEGLTEQRMLYGAFNAYADHKGTGYNTMMQFHRGDAEVGKVIIDRLESAKFAPLKKGFEIIHLKNAVSYMIGTDAQEELFKAHPPESEEAMNGPFKKALIEKVRELYKVND